MNEQEQLNWVEKRHMAAKHLANSKALLWHDVCAALTDASGSFNSLYAGTTEATPINGHRFRVVFKAEERVEIAFDDQRSKISASYVSPFHFRNFEIKADHLGAFIVDNDGSRLTPDEVSESILSPLFFSDAAT
jgi:hypothetical protein